MQMEQRPLFIRMTRGKPERAISYLVVYMMVRFTMQPLLMVRRTMLSCLTQDTTD
jgi:hypothetical protein